MGPLEYKSRTEAYTHVAGELGSVGRQQWEGQGNGYALV